MFSEFLEEVRRFRFARHHSKAGVWRYGWKLLGSCDNLGGNQQSLWSCSFKLWRTLEFVFESDPPKRD